MKTCPNNLLAQDGRCRRLVGAVVSFERLATSQLLSATRCDARGCRVTAEAKSGANPLANQKWIVADGGDDTIVLRNFQHGSLINVTAEGSVAHCWPDHGRADCSEMPGSVQFRSVVSSEGKLGLLSVANSRYLLLTELIDFSEEMSPASPVPAAVRLHPTILIEPTTSAAPRYYGNCDIPIVDELGCKLAAAQQGVIQYSQFSPWNGDESFPPHCFYFTQTVDGLALTRLVLNVKKGAAERSYNRYSPCSKLHPCLCKK